MDETDEGEETPVDRPGCGFVFVLFLARKGLVCLAGWDYDCDYEKNEICEHYKYYKLSPAEYVF